MEFRILGRLEVHDGQRVLELRGSRERELLAYLLLHANEPVATERLIDELWGTEPPATVSTVLHVYVSRLRKLLGRNGSALITRRPGYVLEVQPDQIDLHRFEQLLATGRRARMEGDPARAAELLREALSLWRGPALADLSEADWAQREIDRLEALRLAALEERVEADLELGRHADLVPELEALAGRHPLNERLCGQLIVALYRCGRHGEALQAYADTRRALAEELGLEPSAGLKRLEQAILVQDPALELTEQRQSAVAAQPPRRITRRRTSLAIAACVVAGGVAATLVFTRGSPHAAVAVVPESVAVIDPATNHVVGDIPLRARPAGMAAGAGAVWVVDYDDGTLVRIDSAHARIVRSIGVGDSPFAVTVGRGRVWVANPSRLVAIDPHYNHVTRRIRLTQMIGGVDARDRGFDTTAAIASGHAGIWVAHGVSALSAVDPVSATLAQTVTLADVPVAIAVADDAVWIAAAPTNRLLAVDAGTGSVTSSIFVPDMAVVYGIAGTPIGNGLAVGYGSVWLAVHDAVRRIDPITGGTTARIPTANGALGAAVGAGSIWVTNYYAGTVSRIDPGTNRITSTIRIGNNPTGVVVAAGRVWVTVN